MKYGDGRYWREREREEMEGEVYVRFRDFLNSQCYRLRMENTTKRVLLNDKRIVKQNVSKILGPFIDFCLF